MSELVSGPTWHPPSTAASAKTASALFTAAFGGEPSGVWSAPGRVNLIGEHVDYAGGVCLPFALGHRTWAAVRPRSDGQLRLVSGQLDEPWTGALADVGPGHPAGWAAYLAGTAWALGEEGLLSRGFGGIDAAVHSDVPVGAGLSSSAALECSLGVALLDLFGGGAGALESPARSGLVRAGVRAENEIALASTGGMDQATAVHARAGYCLRLDCATFETRQLPLAPAGHGLAILVVNTNAPHRLVDSQYQDRRAAVDRAAALLGVPALGRLESVAEARSGLAAVGEEDPVLLRRVRHVITESARARAAADLLEAGRVAELGPLLDASHTSLRDDYALSCPELESAVDAARAAGALGARLVGGGFGGSAIALVGAAAVGQVVTEVRAEAARRGLTEPSFLLAEPSAAAGRG
ncbi:MAG: galactokinase [Pseudonocardiales bacterium]|nr:galactokinase [Pseudonocardiales bacterium]